MNIGSESASKQSCSFESSDAFNTADCFAEAFSTDPRTWADREQGQERLQIKWGHHTFQETGPGLWLSFYFIVIWRESGSLQVKNKPPSVTWPSQTVWVHYTRQTVASCVVNGSQREWSIKCLNLYGINRQRSSVWVGWGSSDWYQLKLQYLSIYTDFSLFIDLFWISLKNPVLVRAVDWPESDDTIRITTRVTIYCGADAQACLCFH